MTGSRTSLRSIIPLAMAMAGDPVAAQQNQLPPPPAPTESTKLLGQATASPPDDSEPLDRPERTADADCSALPQHAKLQTALREVVVPGDSSANGGLGNHMWGVLMNREGVVCAVARSGEQVSDQWPGSRAIAAAKANTANGFSLPGFALSTANVYWPSQPGGSLYGIETSNPADPTALAEGPAAAWGTPDDPLVGSRVGGAVVFAGGLALYSADGQLVGAIGLSGDEPCTDHVIAWRIRDGLGLDHVPDGVSKTGNDNIIFDIVDDPSLGRRTSASGYGHPECSPRATTIAKDLERTHSTGAP